MTNALSPSLHPEECVSFWGQKLVGYQTLSVGGSVQALWQLPHQCGCALRLVICP